jgi:2-oxoglutarate dehydrogenase E1 component
MYRAVTAHPTVRESFAATLVAQGTVAQDAADAMVKKHFAVLEKALASLKPEEDFVAPIAAPVPAGTANRAKTGVPVSRLREINESLLTPPAGFVFHKKLERGRERRRQAFASPDERTVDWATAEEMAFASILADGIPIRFTGEDVERGTFSHRHAVYHDAHTGKQFVPLQEFAQSRAGFEIHNSALSENAVIGFEFGYNIQAPGRLVLWEAQYGDFLNGAQVILDQFVTSGRSKWGLQPSLVFLLPHGYEGQGPEHSSARPERILQAAADINLRLVNCTTAAQYFHLLRRQAALLTRDPLPLFVLTPKSLLRHPMVASTPRELEEGRFLSVIDDADARTRAPKVRRLVLCSGKVYVDLAGSERRPVATDVALCRVEQLYPFPHQALREIIDGYAATLREIVWVQEEPENMGAWEFMRPLLEELIDGRFPLRYVGRARSASPSEGSAAWHQLNQKLLVEQAFDPDNHQAEATEGSMVLSKQVR